MFNEMCCDCLHRQVCIYDVAKNNLKECDFKLTEKQITGALKKSNRNWRRKVQRLRKQLKKKEQNESN